MYVKLFVHMIGHILYVRDTLIVNVIVIHNCSITCISILYLLGSNS